MPEIEKTVVDKYPNTKYLKSTENGAIYIKTNHLLERKDMEPYYGKLDEKGVPIPHSEETSILEMQMEKFKDTQTDLEKMKQKTEQAEYEVKLYKSKLEEEQKKTKEILQKAAEAVEMRPINPDVEIKTTPEGRHITVGLADGVKAKESLSEPKIGGNEV